MASQDQIIELLEIMERVIRCGADMKRLKKTLLDSIPDDHVRAVDVTICEYEQCDQLLCGDSAGANGQFFRLMYRKTRDFGTWPNGKRHGPAVELAIYCPTFLRGRLGIKVDDGNVWGSY